MALFNLQIKSPYLVTLYLLGWFILFFSFSCPLKKVDFTSLNGVFQGFQTQNHRNVQIEMNFAASANISPKLTP